MKPLSLIVLLISLTANSSDLSAPQAAIQKYFEYFNAKNIDSLNNASGQPFTLINGGQISKWNKYGDAVDFSGLESSVEIILKFKPCIIINIMGIKIQVAISNRITNSRKLCILN